MAFVELPLSGEGKKFKPLPFDNDGGGFREIPIRDPLKQYEQEDPPYMAQHPNLYAAKETAKDLAKDIIPYVKYFDPKEREDFMKLDKQHQVRALLKENLFSQLFLLPGSRGAKYGLEKAGSWFAKNFPKTTKFLTKPRMLTQLQKEERAIELANQTPVVQKLNKVLKEAKPIRAEQEKMYTATRAYRMSEVEKVTTGGEAGYYERIGKLKGKMPKAQFEPIRNNSVFREQEGIVFQGGGKGHETGFYTSSPSKAKIFAKDAMNKGFEPEIRAYKVKDMPEDLFYDVNNNDILLPRNEFVKKYGREFGDPSKRTKPFATTTLNKYEKLQSKITQADTDALFTQLQDSQRLNSWEKITAGRGLAKIFGELGGGVPQEKELEFLSKEFGTTFTKTILSKQSLFTKMKDAGYNIANIPRSVMASFDLSAPLRQGLFLTTKPKQFFSATKSMFKPFVSEKAYQELVGEITSRPTYSLMEESGLSITGLGKGLTNREEAFMSNWAERIPLVGRGVRASERAYVGFLNKLRADVFDDFVEKGIKLGIGEKRYFKDAARFVNTATGRGGLGPLESSAVTLNTVFFSPRLMMSRLNLLNPAFYTGLESNVRKEALKSLFIFGSTALGTAGLLKYGGAEIEFDPRSADFMKAKFGNTRYDFLGGFQQPIRAAAQMISGKVISSTTGKTMTLGEGYRALTRTEIASRFLEYKEAPLVSFTHQLIRGTTALGEKFDLPTEVMNRFVPMVIRDIQDIYNEKGFKDIPMAFPAIFGVGVQTYGGVQSFGLNGKDYPKLQKELLRLKTSMGYPSTVAFGESLSNNEYKNLKRKTGVEVANYLSKLVETPFYQERSDTQKIRFIEDRIDILKDKIKMKMFPRKMKKSILKSAYKSSGDDDETADKKAEERLKRHNR